MNQKVAIPVDNEDVLDAHFGHCKFFYIANISDGKVISTENIVPPPHEPGLLPKWLAERAVTDIVAGGMGQKAIQLFNANNVNVFVGAPKLKANELVNGFLSKSLSFTANYCDH
ncbi:NifB/NifX family molybdenum-iron cluster-binding protein [Saccharicrinis fermentans]|uniref:Dinitrogenase iron-molybdenum cofactor n=1 Tax=Saccharicrinis fermentans DSM 9555 = JCM 21142 TaxID=869213 RepID=W7Y382_9BACT|nr:NifB/NifX family molybdenum-iron cluster-binding protein [Saccharicrinis fermentans]GAF05300.1 dinitrogenase iron-molybdenum cofactor [Saccharicrinis fermentans DSM 9555 = JCM 21142]